MKHTAHARPRFSTRRAALVAGALCVLLPAMLSATVEEQRARLPPPATCQDPVEGIWRAHRHDEAYGDWAIFTLSLRRAAAGSVLLTGTIAMEFWSGSPQEQLPPPCRPGLRHYIVDQNAVGRLDPGGALRFDATNFHLRQDVCPGSFHGYNLDHFSGVIDAARQEFQSVNNDGGRANNEPNVFRRVGCFDAMPAPHVEVAPPPFQAPPTRHGCSR